MTTCIATSKAQGRAAPAPRRRRDFAGRRPAPPRTPPTQGRRPEAERCCRAKTLAVTKRQERQRAGDGPASGRTGVTRGGPCPAADRRRRPPSRSRYSQIQEAAVEERRGGDAVTVLRAVEALIVKRRVDAASRQRNWKTAALENCTYAAVPRPSLAAAAWRKPITGGDFGSLSYSARL